MIDTRAMRFETLRYGWDEENPLSGRRARRAMTTSEDVKIA
jgi:hypothetical protein